eukprot:5379583-Pleurochrysis_carterae.AAC.1
MLTAVAELHFLSAVCCIAIVLIHTYWIHGSHVLGIAEHSNPTLVTYVSRIDFGPAYDCSTLVIKRVIACAPDLIVRTAHAINEVDENINDAV